MKVKILLAISIFASYIYFVPQVAQLDNFQLVVNNTISASVGIFTVCNGNTLYGGGTIVGTNGKVLTVAHLIPNDNCHVVVKRAGITDVVGARIVRIDAARDLALVSIDKPTLNAVYLGEDGSKLHVGESIFTVGAPGHLQGTVTKGIVSNTSINEGISPDTIIYDVTVLPGSSGGGVFTETGKMYGVLKASVGNSPNGNSLAIGIRRQIISDFLKENMQDADYPRKVF